MAKVSKKSHQGSQARTVVTERDGDLAHIERILALMTKHEVSELEWEKPGERIKLKSGVYSAPVVRESVVSSIARSSEPAMVSPPNTNSTSVQTPAANPAHKQVVSPFVGTFYRSASPTSDPYVKEGQAVKRGDVLCIVEAMKLMNEIDADFACRVVSVLVENGQPVEFGEPLFIVEA